MKTIILLCAIAILASGASAQNTATTSNSKSSLIKKAGKVWIVKPMQYEETLSNGLLVKPTGVVKTSQGKTIILGNGDCIGISGKVVGLNEPNVSSALVKNGKMWAFTQLEEPLILSNRTIVLPNGNVKRNDGTIMLLKNHEIVDIASNKSATWKPTNAMALNK